MTSRTKDSDNACNNSIMRTRTALGTELAFIRPSRAELGRRMQRAAQAQPGTPGTRRRPCGDARTHHLLDSAGDSEFWFACCFWRSCCFWPPMSAGSRIHRRQHGGQQRLLGNPEESAGQRRNHPRRVQHAQTSVALTCRWCRWKNSVQWRKTEVVGLA